ncbi:DNA polymerase III subunit beta [Corynebacterium pseudokroppenstedtii]|uniref:Beta sliding clamp n=1 Tax=Corynebacterium pseudokroppenstedtii TaxID=2804917 RepID=A0AAU0PYQ1_9CORY|nr:DNA polymerase III subunit beta [Corynebacterium pseudokroppenstedtii]QRP14401.1 DNA polymerase III subunit beta [Corynebacterium kroppenstedtii]MBY0790559.1 DNA polymerase III subunit beta [Corynebacterium pseudokroppenstedtii]MCF6792900.1 DNA polymerase III subunit beta [Corynebacterium pseudokroppenstedtii]MCF8702309.1 DNA polymerase III subunit beta [Corynebacterium pseudokroppenstedtii]MCG2635550.1 DNA polymerase III subunit beta [Corynebacterium pseudokroppenstedtii]
MEPNGVSFRVAKDDLSAALSWVARSLASKPTQPILRGVMMTADDDGLLLAGFDYEVSTRVRISAEVLEPGQVLVAGKLANDIIGSLPHKDVAISVDGTKVHVTCGQSNFELPAMTIEDYPELPALPEETGHIDPHVFTAAIGQVASAAGKDDSMPMLTGIKMEVKGDNVVLAATDRFRLAVREFTWEPSSPDVDAEILIPARTLADSARTLDTRLNDPIQLAMGAAQDVGKDGLLGIVSENRQTTTRLIDADFPKFRPLLPKSHSSMAIVEIAPLLDAIRRVSLVAERNAQVKLEFSEDQLVLSAGGSEAGTAEETLPAQFAGEPLLIAFNANYLKEGLASIDTKNVVFGFTQPSRPAILIPEPETMPEQDSDGQFPTPSTYFTYLLMPVRLPG